MSRFKCAGYAVVILRAVFALGQVATPTVLNTNLAMVSAQGTSVSLGGVDPLSCPAITMSQTWTGGKLIFSDSPESPTTSGMVYLDTNLTATVTAGPNRIFLYHVNSNAVQRMKFSVLVQNRGTTNGTLVVKQSGAAGPSTSYGYAGEVAFARWLTNFPGTSTSLAAGQTVRLDSSFDSTTAAQNYLMNGIWDYTFDQPHTIMICALYAGDDPLSVGPTLPVLARDGHERGTFTNCNKLYQTSGGTTVNTTGGIKQFPIAGSGDNYVTGRDYAVSPTTSETNSGNYGVLYQIVIACASGDGRGLGLVINPRAGAWSGAISTPANLYAGGDFILPNGGGTLSDNTQAVVAGAYYLGKGPITAQFMPTGGVSFPVRACTVPFNPLTPVIGILSNYTVSAGQTVSFTATAAGTNTTRTFALAAGPSNATMNSGGAFNWRAPVSSAGTSNTVKVVVGDNSAPPNTNVQSFGILVNPLSGPVTISTFAKNAAGGVLQVNGPIGPDYILQANNSVTSGAGWRNLSTNTPAASPFTITDTNTTGAGGQFYRLQLAP